MDVEINVPLSSSIPETVIYDFITSTNVPFNNLDKDTMKFNNNNNRDYEENKPFNGRDSPHIFKFPIKSIPPMPQKNNLNNNNNNINMNGSNSIYMNSRKDNYGIYSRYRSVSPEELQRDANFNNRTNNNNNRVVRNNLNGANESCNKYNNNRQGTQTVYYHNYNGNYKNRFQQNKTRIHNPQSANNIARNSQHNIMVRRAHGLVERFKSRSEIMQIDPNPAGLLNGSSWDQLNQAIWDVFTSKAQKEHTYQQKINLWKTIFLYIGNCLSNYGLFMVGSTMSGFGLENSDIDMCLLIKPMTCDQRLEAVHHLENVRTLLIKYDISTEPELILAKVPILKFKDKQTGFEIDLNCNNAVGIRNTHLLYCYGRMDWRVRPLIVMIKLWAQANNINNAKNMTISSYSWALMVIHYLQCGVSPPVLPCLHNVLPETFNLDIENHNMNVQEEIPGLSNYKSENQCCLGDLLVGFFHYYSRFNYNQYAISVRTGFRIPIYECRYQKAPKNDPHQWKYLCIEEPFDLTNTARSVFDVEIFKHIKKVIQMSYQHLEMTKALTSILPVKLDES